MFLVLFRCQLIKGRMEVPEAVHYTQAIGKKSNYQQSLVPAVQQQGVLTPLQLWRMSCNKRARAVLGLHMTSMVTLGVCVCVLSPGSEGTAH